MKIGKVYITSDNAVFHSSAVAIDREVVLTNEIKELPFGINDGINNKTELVRWIRENRELVTHIIQEGKRLEKEIQTKVEPSTRVEEWANILASTYDVMNSADWIYLFEKSPFHDYMSESKRRSKKLANEKKIKVRLDGLGSTITFYYHE